MKIKAAIKVRIVIDIDDRLVAEYGEYQEGDLPEYKKLIMDYLDKNIIPIPLKDANGVTCRIYAGLKREEVELLEIEHNGKKF